MEIAPNSALKSKTTVEAQTKVDKTADLLNSVSKSTKKKDKVGLRFSLMAVGNNAEIIADTLKEKVASKDGDDVLGSVLVEVGNLVLAERPGGELGLRVTGYGEQTIKVAPSEMRAEGNRIEYTHPVASGPDSSRIPHPAKSGTSIARQESNKASRSTRHQARRPQAKRCACAWNWRMAGERS